MCVFELQNFKANAKIEKYFGTKIKTGTKLILGMAQSA
jgi:hypothetical protein